MERCWEAQEALALTTVLLDMMEQTLNLEAVVEVLVGGTIRAQTTEEIQCMVAVVEQQVPKAVIPLDDMVVYGESYGAAPEVPKMMEPLENMVLETAAGVVVQMSAMPERKMVVREAHQEAEEAQGERAEMALLELLVAMVKLAGKVK